LGTIPVLPKTDPAFSDNNVVPVRVVLYFRGAPAAGVKPRLRVQVFEHFIRAVSGDGGGWFPLYPSGMVDAPLPTGHPRGGSVTYKKFPAHRVWRWP